MGEAPLLLILMCRVLQSNDLYYRNTIIITIVYTNLWNRYMGNYVHHPYYWYFCLLYSATLCVQELY